MNLGFSEMLFIFILAMIIFGPKRLPEIGRQIGKALSEFKRASNDFKAQLEAEMRQMELEEALKKEKDNFQQILQAPAQAIAAITGLGGITPGSAEPAAGNAVSPSTDAAVASNAWAAVPAAAEYAASAAPAPLEAAPEVSTGAPAAENAAGSQDHYVTVHPSPWDDAAGQSEVVGVPSETAAPGDSEASAGSEAPSEGEAAVPVGAEVAGPASTEVVSAQASEPEAAGVAPWRSWSQGSQSAQTAGNGHDQTDPSPDLSAPEKQVDLTPSSAPALPPMNEPGKENNA